MSIIKEDPLKTSLVNEVTTKLDCRIEFFGMCDYLQCNIMENRCLIEDESIKEELIQISKTLSIIMGEVANGKTKLGINCLNTLLDMIKKHEPTNSILTEFVIPGQNLVSSHLHITRTIARRCELVYAKVYSKYNTSKIIFEYLNKLSLLFYYLACKFE